MVALPVCRHCTGCWGRGDLRFKSVGFRGCGSAVYGLGNPRGSEHPNNEVLGPQYYNLNGSWYLKPYYLGTWTLREQFW